MIDEVELNAALKGICDRLSVPGHLLLYLEGDKIKFTGNITLSALMPLVLEWLSKKQ